tara:strand:- start:102 stop:1673 length:1572 start_codon:yes stop_codon:yes gene_type:complete
MKLQLKRSNVLELGAAKEPTAIQMEYGELAVNYNNGDPAIFLKDSNDNIIRIAGTGNINSGDNPSGDTLPPTGNDVGDMFFNTTNNTMYYWDGSEWTPIANDVTAADIFVGTITEINAEVPVADRRNGFLWWNTEDGTLYIWYIDANTSQFVIAIPAGPGGDGGANVAVLPTPPTTPNQGDMWWNTNDGRLYIYYTDVDSSQWVDASPDSQVSPITSGETFPTDGLENDCFFNTTDGRLYIYYDDGNSLQWVDASPDSQGAVYWNKDGSMLVPLDDSNGVDIGDGNITLNADGTSKFAGRCTIGTATLNTYGVTVYNNTPGSAASIYANNNGTGRLFDARSNSQPKFIINGDGTTSIGGDPTLSPPGNTIQLSANGSATFLEGRCQLGTSGGNSPNGYKFASMGSGAGTNTVKYSTTTGALTYDTSSARYKDNIRDSEVGLTELMQLRSVKFEYKDDGRTDIGLIAEEVFPVIPTLVGVNEDGQPDSVSYDRMVSVLTKALQEAVVRIEALEAKVQSLQGGTN